VPLGVILSAAKNLLLSQSRSFGAAKPLGVILSAAKNLLLSQKSRSFGALTRFSG
jgi:hypothetical protein